MVFHQRRLSIDVQLFDVQIIFEKHWITFTTDSYCYHLHDGLSGLIALR